MREIRNAAQLLLREKECVMHWASKAQEREEAGKKDKPSLAKLKASLDY